MKTYNASRKNSIFFLHLIKEPSRDFLSPCLSKMEVEFDEVAILTLTNWNKLASHHCQFSAHYFFKALIGPIFTSLLLCVRISQWQLNFLKSLQNKGESSWWTSEHPHDAEIHFRSSNNFLLPSQILMLLILDMLKSQIKVVSI